MRTGPGNGARFAPRPGPGESSKRVTPYGGVPPTISTWLCGHEFLCFPGRSDEHRHRKRARGGVPGRTGSRRTVRPQQRSATKGADLPRLPRAWDDRGSRQVLSKRPEHPPRLGDVRCSGRGGDGRAHVPREVSAERDVPHFRRVPGSGRPAAAAGADRTDPPDPDRPGVVERADTVADPGLQHLQLHARLARGLGHRKADRGPRVGAHREPQRAVRHCRTRGLGGLRCGQPRARRSHPETRPRPQLR